MTAVKGGRRLYYFVRPARTGHPLDSFSHKLKVVSYFFQLLLFLLVSPKTDFSDKRKWFLCSGIFTAWRKNLLIEMRLRIQLGLVRVGYCVGLFLMGKEFSDENGVFSQQTMFFKGSWSLPSKPPLKQLKKNNPFGTGGLPLYVGIFTVDSSGWKLNSNGQHCCCWGGNPIWVFQGRLLRHRESVCCD